MVDFKAEIDSRLPYRIGCPILPVLPVKTTIYNSCTATYIPDFETQEAYIQDVLVKYNIPQCGIHLAVRATHGTQVSENNLTIVILSHFTEGCQDNWIEAVKTIRTNLAKSQIYLAIELIDENVFNRPLYTSPILSTNRGTIDGWRRVKPKFLAAIEDQNWIGLDVFHREYPSRGMQPTIIISAKDANDNAWWNSTLPNLRQLLQSNDFDADITILHLEAIQLAVTEDRPAPSVSSDFYQDTLYMGGSCGTPYSSGSGTLGGSIKLQLDSATLELAITNYHVMKDAFVLGKPKTGAFPPDQMQRYSIAVSPSDDDHDYEITNLRTSCARANTHYQEICERYKYLDENDPSWDSAEMKKAQLFRRHQSLDDYLTQANQFYRHVGRTYAASGFRTCENLRYGPESSNQWALDWCLIEIGESKFFCNRLEDIPMATNYARSGSNVTHYCSISKATNYKVIKRGRTTDYTVGKISAIDSIVQVQGDNPSSLKTPTRQQTKFENKFGNRPVYVHAILGKEGARQFMKPGDSGCLVVLDQPFQVPVEGPGAANQATNSPPVCVAGLGFAIYENLYASYMMPFDLVVDDIETVTGGKVVEPHYAGLT